MSFRSILFDRTENGGEDEGGNGVDEPGAPPFFVDLNLDQVVAAVVAGRDEYRLAHFFHVPLHDVDAIAYRHEVVHDLQDGAVFGHVAEFAARMRTMREHLAQIEELHYAYQKEAWFLDAVRVYCDAVERLADGLAATDLSSRGLQGFREYLNGYVASAPFTSLLAEVDRIARDLGEVRYCLNVRGNRVTVSRYEGEADYSAEVEATFAKFAQGAVESYLAEFGTWADMNHVEAQVLDLVARLHPDVFSRMDAFHQRHRDYLDEVVGRFDREVQFYVAYLEHTRHLEGAGLPFCFPRVSASKEILARDTFDMALAARLVPEAAPVVRNDFHLDEPERVIVVTGPNQGGKTTFARTFGQLHYLASLGLPVPGREARLLLWDRLFTHFEKEEDLQNLAGRLEDDLLRIRAILERATSESVVIMNESFTSTTLDDALFLGTRVMRRIVELDLLCVYVTFVDELASLGETTVSMASTVVPENPAQRTFKVVRKPADGLAYAAAIAEKHGLTYVRLKERMAS